MENIVIQVQMLFLKYGIKSVTMDDIARALSMSKKTLYQHFKNKSDLVIKVMENHLKFERQVVEQISGKAKNAMEELIMINHALCKHIGAVNPSMIYDLEKYHPEAMKLLEDYKYNEIFNHILENIKRGTTEGLYREDFDPNIIALLYVARIDSLINSSKFTNHTLSEVGDMSIIYHLHGIASVKGNKVLEKLKLKYNAISA